MMALLYAYLTFAALTAACIWLLVFLDGVNDIPSRRLEALKTIIRWHTTIFAVALVWPLSILVLVVALMLENDIRISGFENKRKEE